MVDRLKVNGWKMQLQIELYKESIKVSFHCQWKAIKSVIPFDCWLHCWKCNAGVTMQCLHWIKRNAFIANFNESSLFVCSVDWFWNDPHLNSISNDHCCYFIESVSLQYWQSMLLLNSVNANFNSFQKLMDFNRGITDTQRPKWIFIKRIYLWTPWNLFMIVIERIQMLIQPIYPAFFWFYCYASRVVNGVNST